MNTASSTTNVNPRARTARISGLAGTLLAATLPAWFALVPAQALAAPASGGNDGIGNVPVPTFGGAWTTLRSRLVFGPRRCIATCSADAINPGTGRSNSYRFTLTATPGAGDPSKVLSIPAASARSISITNP